MPPTGSIVDLLTVAADRSTVDRFVGHSVLPADGDVLVPWRQIHEETRLVELRGTAAEDVVGQVAASDVVLTLAEELELFEGSAA